MVVEETRKRKAEEGLEGERGGRIGDDYGWDERDEVGLPLLGPQTQGSEDVLVVPEDDTETEGEEGWGRDEEQVGEEELPGEDTERGEVNDNEGTHAGR